MKSTDFLFARPSLIRGISKILDIGATSNNHKISVNSNEADLKALSYDWQIIGDDMRGALNDYER